MLNKQLWGITSRVVVATVLIGSLGCRRVPSLEDRIRAASSRLEAEWSSGEIPRGYEHELVGLAKEPTSDLREAFRTLDAERSRERGGRPSQDPVWLTGTLITILAFDPPRFANGDWISYDRLKGRLEPPDHWIEATPSPANDKMLANWPWSDEGGTWRLRSIAFTAWGISNGEISTRFEYYESNSKRRHLP